MTAEVAGDRGRPPEVATACPVLDADFAQEPYALFARLRPRGAVHRVRTQRAEPVWLVLGHAQARQALRNRDLVTDPTAAVPPLAVDHPHPLVLEGQDHARVRGLLTPRLSRPAAERLRPRVEQLADELLDPLLCPGAHGAVDLLAAYAQPLATRVLYEVLGAPPAGMAVVAPLLRRVTAPGVPDAELVTAWTAFTEHVRGVLADKRRAAGDDLLTDLIRACDAGHLSGDELLGTVRLLLQVGDETIWHVLGNGVLTLTEQPGLWSRLRRRPYEVPQAVEELLRHDAPVNAAVTRYAAADTTVGDVLVRTGEPVLVSLTAGGRDPERFDRPSRVDLARDNAQSIGFGLGPHYCVGAALARVQCEVGLQRLLARCTTVRLAVPRNALRRRPVPLLHGWESLPVLLEPEPPSG